MSKKAQDYANYKNTLNSKNVILLTVAGSELLGLDTGSADRDEMGIYLEHPTDLIGFAPQDTIVYRTATDRTGKTNAPSEPGDIDLTLYGMRKYLNLVMGGNPNLVNLLYVPPSKCLIRTFLGEELQKLAPKIISKQAGKAFLGYLQAQRLRLAGTKGQKAVNRPDLELRHGFDTKYAMHMLRLGYQGKSLLSSGKLTFPIDYEWRDYLLKVRNGRVSYDQCLEVAENQEYAIINLMTSSSLPDKPDYEAVEKWMLETYLDRWSELRQDNAKDL